MSLDITPQTRVGDLLDAFPGIEDSLIEWVPAFRKLKNPILRKTVAKVATLDQAARIGNVNVRELVLKLREAAGQGAEASPAPGNTHDGCVHAPASVPNHDGMDAGSVAPDWIESNRVHTVLDAEVLLASGDHPLGKTQVILTQMSREDSLRIDSTFRPAPLIDMFRNKGLRVHCREVAPGRYQTWLAHP